MTAEYRNNLGHAVEARKFNHAFHQETLEITKEIDSKIRAALKSLGVHVPKGEDPRKMGTIYLNGAFANDPLRLVRLSSALWNPNVSSDESWPKTGGVLSPREIEEGVIRPLAALAQEQPDCALEWYTRHPTKGPLAYIAHMNKSGHGTGTTASIRYLRDLLGLSLEGPCMEVGSGPGNISAQLFEEGALPKGELHLVDIREGWLGYAQALFSKIDRKRRLVIHPHDAATVEPTKGIQTAWTALTLQWFKEPDKTIENLARIMLRDGTVYVIGEGPTNATAPTPDAMSGVDGLDIGFSEGAYSYQQVCGMFASAGFVPLDQASILGMAIPEPSPEFIESLTPADRQLAKLIQDYSDHRMVGTVWKRA